MPRSRSICSWRLLRSLCERNISATQVLLQSKLSPASCITVTCRTASRFTPHDLQNFNSSACVDPHWGQNILCSSGYFLNGTNIIAFVFNHHQARNHVDTEPVATRDQALNIWRCELNGWVPAAAAPHSVQPPRQQQLEASNGMN